MITHLDQILAKARALPEPMPAVIVHPTSDVVLHSALQAQKLGIIEPIFVGVTSKIQAAADAGNINIDDIQMIDVPHSHAAVEKAAELTRQGNAKLIVKGSVHTDELMEVLVDANQKMRTNRRMSHVFVMQVSSYPKLLLITDAALNVEPDLMTKRDILQNAINLAHVLDNPNPKVAILSAQENIKPQLPSTIDAAALCKMADRDQITGAILDGPLAFDNAINKEAADIKGIKSPVSGDVDILLTPDLESGNMLAKQLTYLANAESAGLVLGAKVPIVLTSRAEHEEGRLFSFALGALVASQMNKKTPVKKEESTKTTTKPTVTTKAKLKTTANKKAKKANNP